MSSVTSSENTQKEEGGSDRSVSNNQFSSVIFYSFSLKIKLFGTHKKARRRGANKFQRRCYDNLELSAGLDEYLLRSKPFFFFLIWTICQSLL